MSHSTIENRWRVFIERAAQKFGGLFEYDQSSFKHYKSPVRITCPHHGLFEQTPDKHLQSLTGCPKCGVEKRAKQRTKPTSFEEAKQLVQRFEGRIVLKSLPTGRKKTLLCYCSDHHSEFPTTKERLAIAKHACPRCAQQAKDDAKRIPSADLRKRLYSKHGTAITYDEAKVETRLSEIEFYCSKHGGPFRSTVLGLLLPGRRFACPRCSGLRLGYASTRLERIRSGDVEDEPAELAILKVKVYGQSRIKVGITGRGIASRYGGAAKAILCTAKLQLSQAIEIEQHIHNKYLRQRDKTVQNIGCRQKKRWRGDTELYPLSLADTLVQEVRSIVAEYEESQKSGGTPPDLLPAIYGPHKIRRKSPNPTNRPRAVRRLDTGEEFLSTGEANRKTGISQGNISAVCRGVRKSAGGLRFAFVQDAEHGIIPCDRPRVIPKRERRVFCVETGEVFSNATAAGRAKSASSSHITTICNGRGTRKKAGGFHWRFADEATPNPVDTA